LERWDGVMWARVVWLRIGTGGSLPNVLSFTTSPITLSLSLSYFKEIYGS
jgi:hypothetical protein